MDDRQRIKVAAELAQAKIHAIVSSHWHTDSSDTHQHRFGLYKELVIAVTNKAMEDHDDLGYLTGEARGLERIRVIAFE
jgi:hypothetical protein